MGCSREQGTHYQCDCMRERMKKLEEALGEAIELLEMRPGWLSQDELRICRIKKAALSSKEASGE